MPSSQAQNPTPMNSAIFVAVTGTPTARAAGASPPAARIQLPYRVRSSSNDPTMGRMIQEITVISMLTGPTLKLDANTACALSNPSMSLIEFDETPPATIRVTARFTPWRTKNVPRVTRKLGRPVLCSSQPLNAPIARETTSAISTPTQTLRLKYQAVRAAVSPEVVTATPADRSNSPPIMSSATATAMMPIVDEPYRIVPMLLALRNAGATARKSTATRPAPVSAPTSGRLKKLAAAERVTTRSSAGLVVVVVISDHLPRVTGC